MTSEYQLSEEGPVDHPEIEQVLFNNSEIQQRVREIAKVINETYAGKQLVVIGILKGAFMFMSDLTRLLTVDHQVDFMALSSYGNSATRGAVRIIMDLRQDITGRDVLIVEDIIDTGYTLKFLRNLLATRGPASISTAVFLRKAECIKVDVPVEFVGFDVPNHWVVGYGLDYAERLRTLPFIGVLKREVYAPNA